MRNIFSQITKIFLNFQCAFLELVSFSFFFLQKVFIDLHLFRDIVHLHGKIFLIFDDGLILNIEFEALVFEVIPFLDDDFKPIVEGVADEFFFQDLGKFLEEGDQLRYFESVGFEVLILVPEGLFEGVAEMDGGILDHFEEVSDSVFGLIGSWLFIFHFYLY